MLCWQLGELSKPSKPSFLPRLPAHDLQRENFSPNRSDPFGSYKTSKINHQLDTWRIWNGWNDNCSLNADESHGRK